MFRIEYPFKKEILACGAEEKASFCLTKKNCAYVVNNLGNLGDDLGFENYQQKIEQAKKELKITPKIISYDLHQEYLSTKYAQTKAQENKKLKCVAVQHHHAHIASCIAENNLNSPAISVVFDNSAIGEDGKLWGGDFFVGDLTNLKRVAHLQYRTVNDTCTCSVSRLFAEVAALIGLRRNLENEGQGIFDLERIMNRSSHVADKIYEFSLKADKNKLLVVQSESIFRAISDDFKNNVSKSIISAGLHNTIIEIVRMVCLKVKQKEKLSDVILTGSVFQNKMLLNGVNDSLTGEGFNVVTHKHFSCNDSHISFGQAVLADAR